MDKIKQLQIKKLLKELDFVESDFNYKNEIVSDADSTFISTVNSFLEKVPELKEVFDKKIDDKIDLLNNKSEEVIDVEHIISDDVPLKIKKIYREIVKATHPDKITNKKLNDLYIQATKFYNNKDIISIYSICDELDIEYEVDENDNTLILDKINKFKGRISFMESTLTWAWYHSENDDEKDQIIMNYIKSQLGL